MVQWRRPQLALPARHLAYIGRPPACGGGYLPEAQLRTRYGVKSIGLRHLRMLMAVFWKYPEMVTAKYNYGLK